MSSPSHYKDASGRYRSWDAAKVKVTVDAPAEAHVELLAKYTDDDIHNLMAYLLTLDKEKLDKEKLDKENKQ